jgi:uncharacterized phosphatase
MNHHIPKKPFYFLRHGETDHNVRKIYDDYSEVSLNENGIRQALEIQKALDKMQFSTVCTSPLLRAQQTKEIALKNHKYSDISLSDLSECQSELWHLFIAWESRILTQSEWSAIDNFLNRINKGTATALTYDDPVLIIAHGGVYWALMHLLSIHRERTIDNCVLMKFSHDHKENQWKVEPII